MTRHTRLWLRAIGLLWAIGGGLAAQAQEAPPARPPAPKDPYRKLAPGVLESVDPARRLDETFSRHDIVELLAFDAKFDWAKDIPFRHEVWSLQLQFKVPRMIWVDVPQASGHMQRKLLWYTVYSVTNTGKVMVPQENADLPYKTVEGRKTWKVETSDKPVRFIPQFILEGRTRLEEGQGTTIAYPDKLIPVAVAPIRAREDKARRFFTTPEMCREIPVGETVWGVVTWQDVNPQIDFFSIYIQGLTNAYRWKDQPAGLTANDPAGKGRKLVRKTLKLNFWRPSDEYYEHEQEIRYGVPGEPDYDWLYLDLSEFFTSSPAAGAPAPAAGE
jgi:hypothetical protein